MGHELTLWPKRGIALREAVLDMVFNVKQRYIT
jgi:hypothetical protein